MFKTLIEITKDIVHWRGQIQRLAVFDLIKKSRGAVFSWAWLFSKPLFFIFVFWFTLEIGLRAGTDMNPPYFLWLVAGLIPWFFIQDILGPGSNVLQRYSYLVNKIKFPISGIPLIFSISTMYIHVGLVIVLIGISVFMKVPLDIYLLQVPLLIILMFMFFYLYSLFTSLLSAISKDFANLIQTLVTPVFWLSGVIFDPASVKTPWIRIVLLFNPVTFFTSAYRDAVYYRVWFWDRPHAVAAISFVAVITLIVMLALYKRLAKEVPDVL